MENNDNSGIKKIVLQLLSDPDFKEDLLKDADKALEGYELSEIQKILIKSLDAEDIEKLSLDNIEEYFSADTAVYTPDDTAGVDDYETFDGDDLFEE